MIQHAPTSLNAQAHVDVIAYTLRLSDLPEGDAELPGDPKALMKIEITAPDQED